ncbi:radical SAM family heme chaperone HemW [Buchnera aphidicola (Kurisakia onigurumii)]|uniref:radical SAM family heme chaperone HemW n=1 Tax=Buchnera aphidicola TaxID=9 RepID=UPI0031B6D02A
MIPISLYIHIPWCTKKCPFCDFNSYTIKTKIEEKKYIDLLIQDLKQELPLIKNRKIHSIFIGGGTPSLFTINNLKKLIKKIKTILLINYKIEITIESYPSEKEKKKILQYQKIGINRISLGIQTFNNNYIKKLNRNYLEKDIIQLLNTFKNKKKIYNFNIDIMHSLPDQSIEEAILDLKKAISFQPTHISWYELTIEPNTPFYYKKLNILSEKNKLKIIRQGNKILKKNGYIQYEISSYCKKKYQCKHNVNYWNFGDYIGIGCGAHGKITDKINNSIIRTIKHKHIRDYINDNFLQKKYVLDTKEIILEFFMNKLRLKRPLLKKDLYNFTGINKKFIQENIFKCIQKGYLTEDNKYWKITKKGELFLNSLLEIFC